MARLRSNLTYANVVATVALFLALAGGTTAIALSGSNTVASDDIIRGQVKSSDIGGSQIANGDLAKDSVSGGKVKPETLFGADIGADAVDASEIAGEAVGSSEILDGAVGTGDQSVVPVARVEMTTPLSVPANSVFTDVSFGTDSIPGYFDPLGMWDPADPEVLTAPVTGYYLIVGHVRWTADFSSMNPLQDQGTRAIVVAGGEGDADVRVAEPSNRLTSEGTGQQAIGIVRVEAGDEMRMSVFQDNDDDSAINLLEARLAASWLGPAA